MAAEENEEVLPGDMMTWLRSRHLQQYAQALADLGVTNWRELLDEVTDEDLTMIGMKKLQRRRFRRADD